MPLIDLANPLNSQGLQQLAGPFGSLLGPGAQFPSSYDFAKRFVQPASPTMGGGNGVTSIEEPTYLGFNLRFDISSPLFNGAEKGEAAVPGGGDDAGGEKNNSTSEIPETESAVGYLDVRGETTNSTYLKAFCQGMLEIQRTRPYYFQTIDGLQPAFAKTVDMLDPYGGAEDGITIGMLEALDLKMTALFNLYKMAIFDVKYKRLRVPKNLLKFNVYIDVLEMRKFKTVRNFLGALNPNSPSKDMINFVNENTSVVTFKFSQCVFDAAESGKVFDGISNIPDSGNMAVSSMKFSYGKVELEAQFSGFDSKLVDAAVKQPAEGDGKFKAAIKQFAKDQIANQAAGAINALERGASSFIQNFTLGNVYGKFNKIKDAIANPQALVNAAVGAAVQSLESEQEVDSIPQSLGDNPFPNPQTQPGNSDDIDTNIYEGEMPAPEPLANQDSVGGNIFAPGPPGPALESRNLFDE